MIGLLIDAAKRLDRTADEITAEISHKLTKGGHNFHPTFSGREAIAALALYWAKRYDARVAYIPDYICNVVHSALEAAGLEIRNYETDHEFEPSPVEIDSILTQEENVILLTASLYGSSALIEYFSEEQIYERIKNTKNCVIIDLCQDITLTKRLPSNYGDKLACTISFNDKSVFGVMGGGILWEGPPMPAGRALSVSEKTKLWTRLALKLAYLFFCRLLPLPWPISSNNTSNTSKWRLFLASRQQRPYEYSYCRSFPNEIDWRIPDRMQLALAAAGLDRNQLYAARKRKKLEAGCYLQTPHVASAPYLVMKPSSLTNGHYAKLPAKQKLPYAIHGDPLDSLKPDLVVVHNKGFADL